MGSKTPRGPQGYSSCRHPCVAKDLEATTEPMQAAYLVRSWLASAMAGVAVSVWCDRTTLRFRALRKGVRSRVLSCCLGVQV